MKKKQVKNTIIFRWNQAIWNGNEVSMKTRLGNSSIEYNQTLSPDIFQLNWRTSSMNGSLSDENITRKNWNDAFGFDMNEK